MSKPDFASDFHRVLYDRVYECDVADFRALLQKHGHDDECLKLMKQAIATRLSREDRGDYRDPATPGWQPNREKQKLLDNHFLNRGPAPAFNSAAPDPNTELFALYEDATRNTPAHFEHLLLMHGKNPEKRAILEQAMQACIKREDPGGWGERQSAGGPAAQKKKELYDAYVAAQNPEGTPAASDASTAPATSTAPSEIEALRAEVAALKQRVETLEAIRIKRLKL